MAKVNLKTVTSGPFAEQMLQHNASTLINESGYSTPKLWTLFFFLGGRTVQHNFLTILKKQDMNAQFYFGFSLLHAESEVYK